MPGREGGRKENRQDRREGMAEESTVTSKRKKRGGRKDVRLRTYGKPGEEGREAQTLPDLQESAKGRGRGMGLAVKNFLRGGGSQRATPLVHVPPNAGRFYIPRDTGPGEQGI